MSDRPAGDQNRPFPASAADQVLGQLAAGLDRDLPVPLSVQLSGLIQYGIALGDLSPGTRLPPVRELAERASIAPMTVVGVYNDLKRQRLIVTRGSAGTFVAPTTHLPAIADLETLLPALDSLLRLGTDAGLGPAELAALLNARATHMRSQLMGGLNIVLVGHFPDATKAYADHIRSLLPNGDKLSWTTLSALQSGEAPEADIVLTIPNRRADVEAIFGPDIPVLGLNFLPSDETRQRLAALGSDVRLGLVSVFPEFMALMKPDVRRFAPPGASIELIMADAPDLSAFCERVDVVIYATGLDWIPGIMPAGKGAFEYRYVPDNGFIQTEVLPRLAALRQSRSPKENP